MAQSLARESSLVSPEAHARDQGQGVRSERRPPRGSRGHGELAAPGPAAGRRRGVGRPPGGRKTPANRARHCAKCARPCAIFPSKVARHVGRRRARHVGTESQSTNLSSPTAARYAKLSTRDEITKEREMQKGSERIWLPGPVQARPRRPVRRRRGQGWHAACTAERRARPSPGRLARDRDGVREMPGDPPARARRRPPDPGARHVAGPRADRGLQPSREVLTYLLVEVPSEYGVGCPVRALPRDHWLVRTGPRTAADPD